MGLNPFDLHALYMPPAFILSQDQTLNKDDSSESIRTSRIIAHLGQCETFGKDWSDNRICSTNVPLGNTLHKSDRLEPTEEFPDCGLTAKNCKYTSHRIVNEHLAIKKEARSLFFSLPEYKGEKSPLSSPGRSGERN